MASDTKEAASYAADAASAPGMPQLDFSNWGNQIFWLVIALLAIYFILSRIALPRIASVLSERQGTITNDLAMAEELKLKAQEAEAAYQQALTDARAEANKIVADARAEIQADLDAATAKAEAEISAKSAESEKKIAEIREGAMEAITEVAKDTTKEIVGALGQSADAKSVTAAVNARLKG